MRKRPPLSEVHQGINFDLEFPNEKESPAQASETISKGAVMDIPIGLIEVDANIREMRDDEDGLRELGESIRVHGQIQPIVVTRRGNKFLVKVGHRRFKACVMRDIDTVRCIVEDGFQDERDRIITQAIENEQRLNLSPRERERYIAQLSGLGMDQIAIARALNKTKGWVSEALTAGKFVSDNQDDFEGLAEEPSTRDAWKLSRLPKAEYDDAMKVIKSEGGTKASVKKEISRRFNDGTRSQKRKNLSGLREESAHGRRRVVISNTVVIDDVSREVTLESGAVFNEELESIIRKDIERFYKKQGYVVI